MQFFENELLFDEELTQNDTKLRAMFPNKQQIALLTDTLQSPTEVLGIKVRLGNKPLAFNLKSLIELSGGALNPAIAATIAQKDYYLIVHAIGALRTQGKAKVDELQYYAEVKTPVEAQTIDLLPNTRFKEVFHAQVNFEGSLSASGQAMVNIPTELTEKLIPQYVSIGGNMQVQLSTNSSFIGKFTFSVQLPVVQAMGVSSNTCSWVLNPDENKTPLLGDQLLVQSVVVPKGTSSIKYRIYGLVKADRGLFWEQQQKQTPEYEIEVKLN